jgi:hypothetical protein
MAVCPILECWTVCALEKIFSKKSRCFHYSIGSDIFMKIHAYPIIIFIKGSAEDTPHIHKNNKRRIFDKYLYTAICPRISSKL